MFGAPADMDAIMRIAKTAGLKVLEDAAQAAGGKYKNKSLGAIADAGAFSFDFGKALTTGEGGMICTADREIFQRCMELADHGHENNPARPRGEDTRRRGGFNYRMTELQGALGLAQLGKLDYIIEQQRKNKAMLIKGIKGIGGLKFRVFAEGAQEAADTLTFTLGSAGKARDFSAKMKQEGLATKNLPDAFSWHFAGTWGHLLSGLAEYRGRDLMRQWPKSCDYLMRTIAMPINVNMPEGRINEIIASLAKIAAEVL
jgi:8-amino-3,8-dideoxy-alpha-D-manno-octulosonate transaminase